MSSVKLSGVVAMVIQFGLAIAGWGVEGVSVGFAGPKLRSDPMVGYPEAIQMTEKSPMLTCRCALAHCPAELR